MALRLWDPSGAVSPIEASRTIVRAHELLAEALRPEFRSDVILAGSGQLPGALRAADCGVAGCKREVASKGMCNGHRVRWDVEGRPDLARFKSTTSIKFRGHAQLESCLVPECRSGRSRRKLCPRHFYAWNKAEKPALDRWIASAIVPAVQSPDCLLPQCHLASERKGYCISHEARWILHGRPTQPIFEAAVLNYGDARYDFRRLPPRIRTELQYALQCRHDRRSLYMNLSLAAVVRVLLRSQASSLLERTREEWDREFLAMVGGKGVTTNGRAFLGYAVEALNDLVRGSGWDNEYPRDVWELRRLGYDSPSKQRRLVFSDIEQEWLRDLAKIWLRWRLTVDEIAIGTASADLLALRRLSQHLSMTGQANESIAQLTRPVLESFLRVIHHQKLSAASARDRVSVLAVFLRQLREHEDWAPSLPRTAVIYASDYPAHRESKPRGLGAQTMAQVNAALPSWSREDLRCATRVMIGSGLRSGDALNLPFDCVVEDDDGHPYIHYWNHKMRREAYVPIDSDTRSEIDLQQGRVRHAYPEVHAQLMAKSQERRYPVKGLRLFPAPTRNSDGSRPVGTSAYNGSLGAWVASAGITDLLGRPVRITSHQWRHTYATSLVNSGVPLEHVRHLLDHVTMDMTQHYARLHDDTVRRAWESARRLGESVSDAAELEYVEADDPLLADAQWANRARTALPNGQCGLPRQQTCPHSNKCLSCPVFVTTAEDLPVHLIHRDRTAALIEVQEAKGMRTSAGQNRDVLRELDRHIATVSGAPQNAG